MKYSVILASAAVLSASVAAAEIIKPTDVTYADGAVASSLTGQPGEPGAGRDVFADRKLGNCLACHVNADLAGESFHGEVGPPLDGVGARWNEAQLRGIVANSKMKFEGTIMPAFYVDAGFNRPLEGFEGVPILTAQQVEDVIAYLMTLKGQ